MAGTKKTTKTTRSKKQHTPDYYPVQRSFPLGVTNAAGGVIAGTNVADAGRLMSQANRRLYRYGMNYQIKLDLDVSSAVNAQFDVEVYALRNTWDVQRAFALAKSAYDEAIAHELKAAGGSSARWLDFRVLDGVTNGVAIHPVGIDNASLALDVIDDGEHQPSIVDKAGVGTNFTWGLANSTRIDIKNEWIESGQTSNDPATFSTTAPYQDLNAEDMSNIEMEGINDRGNAPPYNSQADNDMLTLVATLRYSPATIKDGLQRLSTGFFDAPCGLFVLKTTAGINLGNGSVHFTAKSGDYKGISAQKMCQE